MCVRCERRPAASNTATDTGKRRSSCSIWRGSGACGWALNLGAFVPPPGELNDLLLRCAEPDVVPRPRRRRALLERQHRCRVLHQQLCCGKSTGHGSTAALPRHRSAAGTVVGTPSTSDFTDTTVVLARRRVFPRAFVIVRGLSSSVAETVSGEAGNDDVSAAQPYRQRVTKGQGCHCRARRHRAAAGPGPPPSPREAAVSE